MASSAKIILGIDPGLADTGFGVISLQPSLTFLTAGTIRTKKDLTTPARLQIIFTEVKKLLAEFKPDLVAIEKLFFARNVTTALEVGQARGVVLLAAASINKPIREFTPLQVKQAVTGSGKADKRQIGLMVKTLLKLDSVPQPDDAADALAIAICAAANNSKLIKA